MNRKKYTGLFFFTLFLVLNTQAEILSWRINEGQNYETQVTVKESIADLESVTEKPAVVTSSKPAQSIAAQNKSTIPYLSGIPSFPQIDLVPGMIWKQEGTISYDISAFGSKEPILVKIAVSYTLVEMAIIESKEYFHIVAEWYPFIILNKTLAKRTGILRLRGMSTMDIYWDNKSGAPKYSTLNEELQYLFSGNASLLQKRITEEEFKTVAEIERERVIAELNKQIVTEKVANVEVKQTEEGIVLSIENIQFEAESAILLETEKAKLTKIGGLLSSLKERKLNIIGHAANIAGSNEEELLTLSSARAQSVADFLVQSGIKEADSVIATGMGGTMPLASNETPEGRSKNRRVEILIIDEENKE